MVDFFFFFLSCQFFFRSTSVQVGEGLGLGLVGIRSGVRALLQFKPLVVILKPQSSGRTKMEGLRIGERRGVGDGRGDAGGTFPLLLAFVK